MLGFVQRAGHRAVGLAVFAAIAATAAGCASSTTSSASAAAGSSVTASAAPSSATASAPASASSSSGGSPTGSPAGSPSPSASHSPTASPSPSPSASGPGSAPAAAACATRDLATKAGIGQGAAGSVYQVIDFTNISGQPCTLYGYPGVSLASGKPVSQVGAAASRDTVASASVITLAPRAPANALLRITSAQNYPSATCSPTGTSYLQIYPPNQYTPIYLAYTSTGCAKAAVKLLTVGVITPGSGG